MKDDAKKDKILDFGRLGEKSQIANDDLLMLESELKELQVEPMTQNESAEFYYRLDQDIDRLESRPGWLYRVGVRYGAIAASFVIMIGLSFMAGLNYQVGESIQSAQEYYYDEYSNQIVESEDLEEDYVELIVSSQVQSKGYNVSDELLGELSDDELLYLEESFDVGALL